MKNKGAKRRKRKTEKQRHQRARARIPRLELSVELGNPTPQFRDALFEATRQALQSPAGIRLMEQRHRVSSPRWQLTKMAYSHLPARLFEQGYPVEQGNINDLGEDYATFIFRRLKWMQQGWYSPHTPSVEFAGSQRLIVWSHHACQRLAERTTRGQDAGEDWHDAFTPLYGLRSFERYHSGIKIWMPCAPGSVQCDLASYITGQDDLPEDAHILVGYADVELLGERLALVKTLLAPGYYTTPEWAYIKRNLAELSHEEIKDVTGDLLTMQGACERGGRDVLRELHENGYPQVKYMPVTVDYFPNSIVQEQKRLWRQADMMDSVFKVILAQRGLMPSGKPR